MLLLSPPPLHHIVSSREDTRTRYVCGEILTNFGSPSLTSLRPSLCYHPPSLFLLLPLPSPLSSAPSPSLPPSLPCLFSGFLFPRLPLSPASSLPSLQSIPVLSEPFTTPITSKQAGIPLASTPLPPAARAGKMVVTTHSSHLIIHKTKSASLFSV